ncbi:type II toxin-antitoxin system CcdA family antitoxin, partial [Escherichia coli]
LWEKGSPLHKSTQQVRTQGPIRHADCRQRKLADFLCTGGIIQGLNLQATLQWNEVNEDAISALNEFAEETGCFSDEYRKF